METNVLVQKSQTVVAMNQNVMGQKPVPILDVREQAVARCVVRSIVISMKPLIHPGPVEERQQLPPVSAM